MSVPLCCNADRNHVEQDDYLYCFSYFLLKYILTVFFHAEDGIRGGHVTGVQTCALPISSSGAKKSETDQEPGKKYLRAFDIETGKIVWEAPQIGPVDGKRNAGVLATAGGIIFYGDPSGDVIALDERDGKALWNFPTNGINKASPMTYMVGGKQFVALAVGPNILCFGLP